ncbi:hypothetical protein [Streptomyces virginiae]|uniref:hypothetical protein n=1 Tax=Streptomyces virginiae TaxID=1961 RepID=UPI002258E824|nr:hypothetical protein [Streptomyces virginiae]MCX4959794.1 hypothetical protein [Streptomyces virginiae]MCX5178624.1 hypothetical protein [Streptomyces virginiae]
MRTRILAVTATLVLAVLGATVPVAQGAVPTIAGPTCEYRGGTVEYDSAAGVWNCVGGTYDGERITS